MTTTLHLRSETKAQEHRAALTPSVCGELLRAGFHINVERCTQRVFADSEYEAVGCTLVPTASWRSAPRDTIIVGLKELPENDDSPLTNDHIMFAHCYKGQAGWRDVLARFRTGNSILLDLEFLHDSNGRRVAAFGYHAGYAGAAVGLDLWAQQVLAAGNANGVNACDLPPIKPYANDAALKTDVGERLSRAVALHDGKFPTMIVIGALGRCGSGACDLARQLGIPESCIVRWDMAETRGGGPFLEIAKSCVFINCIYLSQPIPPFLTKDFLLEHKDEKNLSVIVDVSCDTTNPHNPIPVYNTLTTFAKPVLHCPIDNSPKGVLDVIAIDHLPTLLPREASESFSNALLPSLLQLKDRKTAKVWQDAEDLCKKKFEELDKHD